MRRSEAIGLVSTAALFPRIAQAQELTTVRLAATPIDSMSPVLFAMRTGLFEKAGLKIELTMMNSGNVVSAAVVGGAIDIGLSSLVAIIQGHLRGIAFTIIAPGGMWIDSDTAGVVVASSSPIRTARDFNGKTIGTNSLQSLDTVAMDAWVDQNGGDSKTVHFFELPALAAAAALTQGRIDGAILGTPAYAAARADGKGRTVGRIYDAIARQFLLGVWFTMAGYVQANRSAAERFSKVVAEASAYTRTHPESTIDDVAQITKLDKDLIAHMPRSWVGTTVAAADIQPVIDTTAKYKFIERGFPASELISSAAAH
jgi:NitT/TauT family transport system substrate-binding protein